MKTILISVSAVRRACKLANLDMYAFGELLSLSRRISPYMRSDAGRIAWGFKCE